jgi:predicted porin
MAGGYQIKRDTTSYFGVTVPNSNQKVWTLGGTYAAGPATLYLGYTNSDMNNADYRNQAVYAGAKYAFSQAWSAIAIGTYDRLRHSGDSGHRFSGALMIDYAFSKRTDAYLESDYTTLSGAWRSLGGQPGFVTPLYGYGSRVGVMAGIRHKF